MGTELLRVGMFKFFTSYFGEIGRKWLTVFLEKIYTSMSLYYGYHAPRIPCVDDLVLHKSCNFILINKKPDVLINSADSSRDTVHQRLIQLFPDLKNPNLIFDFWFIHRLDFSTSGIMCVALKKDACSQASEAFRLRLVKKYYLAVVRGHVPCAKISISHAIGQRIDDATKHLMCTDDEGCIGARDAITVGAVISLGYYKGDPATKVLLKPITGRRHQLRVHCAKIGHPIVGDYSYSNKTDVDPPRMYLHSYRLVLPTMLEMIDITTNDPFNEQHPEWVPKLPVYPLNELLFELLDEMSCRD